MVDARDRMREPALQLIEDYRSVPLRIIVPLSLTFGEVGSD